MASDLRLGSALLALDVIEAAVNRARELRSDVGVRAARIVIEGQIAVIANLGFTGELSHAELMELGKPSAQEK